MEFETLSESDAEGISAYVHDMWVDTYSGIIIGGRARAESIFDNWIGPEKIRSDMRAGHFFAYLVTEGTRVGLISAGKEGDDLMISKVYIGPEHRRRGYATEAMEYIFDYGRQKGCSRAVLEVNPRNTAAISFYENIGFRGIGQNVYEYGYTTLMAADLRRP